MNSIHRSFSIVVFAFDRQGRTPSALSDHDGFLFHNMSDHIPGAQLKKVIWDYDRPRNWSHIWVWSWLLYILNTSNNLRPPSCNTRQGEGSGQNACQDGLVHLFREEWNGHLLLGGLNLDENLKKMGRISNKNLIDEMLPPLLSKHQHVGNFSHLWKWTLPEAQRTQFVASIIFMSKFFLIIMCCEFGHIPFAS